MSLPVDKGQKVSQYADILGDLTKTCTNDTGVIQGEVYAANETPFVVIAGASHAKATGTNIAVLLGWTEGHYVVTKKAASSSQALTKGDPITFEAVSGHDYLQARKTLPGEPIHAYCFQDALTTDTVVRILGPFAPPFQTYGTMADILAAISSAASGQVVVTDGTGGVSVLSVAASAAITDVATVVSGANAGQVLVADGSNGVGATDYVIPTEDGADGQVLKQASANTLAFADDATA